MGGSKREGVINIREAILRTYTNVVLRSTTKGLSQSTVLQLYQEPASEELWIATDGGGINKFIPSTETFVHYPDTWGDKMVSITGFTQRIVSICLFQRCLYVDKKTGKKRPFAVQALH